MKPIFLATAIALFASPAWAEGIKPPSQPDPLALALHQALHNTNQQAQIQHQGQGQQQGQIAHGGAGGNAASASRSNAQGGAGGNAQARGGNANAAGGQANARGGNQSQSAQGGSVGNISIDASSQAAAASAVAPSVAGCSRQGGGFSAAMQAIGWGVSASNCKGFVGPEVIEAEERYLQGKRASVAYLCRFDQNACDAFKAAGYAVTK